MLFFSKTKYAFFYSTKPKVHKREFLEPFSHSHPILNLADSLEAASRLDFAENDKPYEGLFNLRFADISYPIITKTSLRLIQTFCVVALSSFSFTALSGLSISCFLIVMFSLGFAFIFDFPAFFVLYKTNKKFKDVSFTKEEIVEWEPGQIVPFLNVETGQVEFMMSIGEKNQNLFVFAPLSDMDQKAVKVAIWG